MSKKFISVYAVFCLFFLANKVSAQHARAIQKVNDTTIMVPNGAIVPKNNTYFIKSSTGKTIATYKGGQTVSLGSTSAARRKVIDCVQIPCPGTFGSDVVCWKCKTRPATASATTH
jgi:hypothetical protein